VRDGRDLFESRTSAAGEPKPAGGARKVSLIGGAVLASQGARATVLAATILCDLALPAAWSLGEASREAEVGEYAGVEAGKDGSTERSTGPY
jgi:hypothetical protein